MNREEAIKILEYPVKKWSMEWDEREDGLSYYEALDMAISALRQQETVAKCNGLFDEDGGEILPKSKRNEPLTLDELRTMDGEPVWVQSPGIPEYGRWAIVEGAGENCLFLHDDFTCHDYGKTWLAYRQSPEEGTD